MGHDYDVIVVGGGPAGAVSATMLARGGARVALVDAARFPRDKTCGDGVSPAAVALLDRLGILSLSTFAAHFHAIHEVRFVGSEHVEAVGGPSLLPRHVDGSRIAGFVSPRRELDRLIFERAAAHVQHAICGDGVDHVLKEGDRIQGVRLKSGRTLRGPLVVGADGVHSAIRRSMGWRRGGPDGIAYAIRAYVEDAHHLNCAQLHVFKPPHLRGGYAWIFPTGRGTANVGIGFRGDALRRANLSLQQVLRSFIDTHAGLSGANVVGRPQGWPLPLGAPRGPVHAPGVMLCGDAAHLVDPLSGEGIYPALRSGELAAEAGLCALDRGPGQLSRYTRQVRAEFGMEFGFARCLHKLAQQPSLIDYVIGHAAGNQRLADEMAAAFGGAFPKLGLLKARNLLLLARRPGAPLEVCPASTSTR